MLQIAFVTDEHDNDIRIGVISELLQPPRHVDVGSMFRDVIDKEGTDCTTVITDRLGVEKMILDSL